MAKIKEIKKVQPQPVQGLWWFKVTLDTGEEAFYSSEDEEPFVSGETIAPYTIEAVDGGRGGKKNMLKILPPQPEAQPQSEYVWGDREKESVVLTAKARACIDAMGYAATIAPQVGKKPGDIYPSVVKAIHGEIDKL